MYIIIYDIVRAQIVYNNNIIIIHDIGTVYAPGDRSVKVRHDWIVNIFSFRPTNRLSSGTTILSRVAHTYTHAGYI